MGDQYANYDYYNVFHGVGDNNTNYSFGNQMNDPYQNKHSRLNKLLLENKLTKSEELDLHELILMELPKELCEFTWVKKLDISTVKVENLNNLPPNLVELRASGNDIHEIVKGQLPATLQYMELDRCELSNVKNLPCGLKHLSICHNKKPILSFVDLPESLEIVVLEGNDLKQIPNLPNSVHTLILNDNGIKELTNLPPNLRELHVAQNCIERIDIMLPQTLRAFDCSSNNLKFITNKFPPELTSLRLFGNKELRYIMSLPDSLINIDCSDCSFVWIPTLPNKIERADFSNNKVRNMNFTQELPPKLAMFDLRGNQDLKLTDEMKKHNAVYYDIDNTDQMFNFWNSGNQSALRGANYGDAEDHMRKQLKTHELLRNLNAQNMMNQVNNLQNPYYIPLTKTK